jgi:hypothetical protein
MLATMGGLVVDAASSHAPLACWCSVRSESAAPPVVCSHSMSVRVLSWSAAELLMLLMVAV